MALTKATQLTSFGTFRTIKVPAGVADTYFQGAVLSFLDATAAGVTPVPASGLRFAGICMETYTDAAVGDILEIAIDGLWKVPVAVANAWDAQGELIHVDISAASDDPGDLVITTATGDYGFGRCEKWIDASNLLANIGVRSAHAVAS